MSRLLSVSMILSLLISLLQITSLHGQEQTNYTKCLDDDYLCKNPVDGCIPIDYVCDYERDCINGHDDEMNCIDWDSWTNWSACSGSCDRGISSRSRVCRKGSPGSGHCLGLPKLLKYCSLPPCPSTECPNNHTICNDPGDGCVPNQWLCNGGEDCLSDGSDESNCTGWDNWTDWTNCSTSCGGGTQKRKRSCRTGSPGSGDCLGLSSWLDECNSSPCLETTTQTRIDETTTQTRIDETTTQTRIDETTTQTRIDETTTQTRIDETTTQTRIDETTGMFESTTSYQATSTNATDLDQSTILVNFTTGMPGMSSTIPSAFNLILLCFIFYVGVVTL